MDPTSARASWGVTGPWACWGGGEGRPAPLGEARGVRAPRGWASPRDETPGPADRAPSRDAVEAGRRTYSSRVRAAGRPFGLPQPRNATGAASSAARRPRTPRPIRPFLRSPLPLRRAEAHCQRDRHPALKMRESAGSKRPRLNTNTRHETRREGPTPVPCTSACLKKKKKRRTSVEKLYGKLGGRAEWPGLFNRRFLSQQADP
jgi:hypothetical protein